MTNTLITEAKALAAKLPTGVPGHIIAAAVAEHLPGLTFKSERHGLINNVGIYTGPNGKSSTVDYLPTSTPLQHAFSALMAA